MDLERQIAELKRRVDEHGTLPAQHTGQFEFISGQLREVQHCMHVKFASMEQEFGALKDTLGSEVKGLNQRLDSLDRRLESLDERM